MNKLLLLLKSLQAMGSRLLSIAFCLVILLGTALRSQAQVYFVTNDGTGTSLSSKDGISKINADGTGRTILASSITNSPGLIALDLPNNRAFVYEAYTLTPPSNLAIRVINLANGTTTNSINFTQSSRISALKYDAVNNYIYYVLQGTAVSNATADDAICRVRPDGTGNTVLLSGADLCKNPGAMALDIPKNRMFVMENLYTDRALLTIDLGTNKVTQTNPLLTSAAVAGVQMDYDPDSDFLYLLTSDNNNGQNPTDAIYKFHTDASSTTVIASKIGARPVCGAFDFPHNTGYFFDNGVSTNRVMYSVNLTSGALSPLTNVNDFPDNGQIYGIALPYRPVVSSTAASNISSTTTTLAGNVVQSDLSVAERGVVYSSSNSTPAIGGTDVTKVAVGTGTGTFSTNLSGLNASTTYYVRAYATSTAGTAYGDVVTFSTISNNANLSALALGSGTLSPIFNNATTTYTAGVTYDVTTIKVTPTVEQANATVKINGTAVTSGTASGSLSLNPGTNTITTVVTAQDGNATKTYTTTVTKDKTPQTITFGTIAAKTYGAADFTLAAAAGSTLTVTYTSDNNNVATVTSAGVVHIVGAGTVNITAAQTGNTTYLAAANVSQQLTVNKAVLTYSANTASRNYGAANPTFTGSVSGFVNSDTQASATTGTMVFTSTATATSNAGTQYPITGSGLSAGNYSFTQADANSTALSINKITVTYTANAATKVYGAANPSFSAQYNGLVNGQTIDQVVSSLSYATTATPASAVGSYPITVDGLTATNYNFTAATANATAFTITKANLTFTANAATRHYGEANPTLSGTISGFLNTDGVSGLSGTATYASTASATSSVGSYPITLSGLSSANYNIVGATGNNTALTITKNTLRYLATAASRAYNTSPNPAVTGTVAGLLNGDTQASATTGTLSFSTSVTQSSPVGTYAITGAGLSSSNYDIIQDASNASAFSIYLAANGNLSNLMLSSGSLSPSFTSTTNNYTATVSTNTTSITVTPTLSDANARLTVNGNSLTSGSVSGSIPLNIGANVIPINVTAQDGTTTNPYNVTVTRLPSSDASLSSMSINPGSIGTIDVNNTYNVTVANTLTSLDVTAVVHEPNATLTIDGVSVTSNTPHSLSVNLGINRYIVDVVAQDGTTHNYYALVVTRPYSSNNLLSSFTTSAGTISPAFDNGTGDYTISVDNATTSTDLTSVLADNTATISYNGFFRASGEPYTMSNLAVGDNTMFLQVQAQNGASKYFNITVHRAVSTDASLTSLGILSPISGLDVPFSSTTYTYNTTVTSDVTSFGLNPVATNSGASITINGVPLNTTTGNGVPLQYFTATEPMVIEVTAGDGVTKQTYTVNVVRQFSTNNLLQSLTVAVNGTNTPLTPDFDPATNNYSLVISDPTITGILVKPTAQATNTEVRVNTVVVNPNASAFVQLQGGINAIPVSVLSFGGGTNIYNLTVTRGYSSNAGLINVILSGNNQFSKIVNQVDNNLSADIPNNVTSLVLIPNASDPGGTVITVNGYAISGGASSSYPLAIGDNVFTVGITAADNSNTQYYTVHAKRLPFVDVTLSALNFDKGIVSPAFSPDVTTYNVAVAAEDDAISVTPVATSPDAAVVAGTDNITPSHPTYTNTSLFAGTNRITVRVTAADGINFKSYSIRVNRPTPTSPVLGGITLGAGTLSPAFAQATTNYSTTVSYANSSIVITPQSAQSNATITVSYGATTKTLSGGQSSVTVPLTVGSNNMITTTITSQDGSASKTYNLTVTRGAAATDATLASLNISKGSLSPAFNGGIYTYNVSVKNDITAISVFPVANDAHATVKIGMAPVSTGLTVPLNVGDNTIVTTVTAEDGSTRPYTITVNRAAASNDAALASLNLGSGTLNETFNPGTYNYTASVSTFTSTLTISPIPNDASAAVKVNGLSVDPSTSSIDVPLSLGDNTINVSVKAPDSTTIKNYQLIVNRSSTVDVDLYSLASNNGSLNPLFNSAVTSYRLLITTPTINFTPTANDPLAIVKVNGVLVNYGTSSPDINLNVGDNIIPITVTAPDSSATKTYTVTVNRAVASTDAKLTALTINRGALNPVFAPATNTYTISDITAESVTLTPTKSDTTSTVTINDKAVGNNQPFAVPLHAGSNTINVEVTAQDYTTTNTYVLTVNRLIPAAPTLSYTGPNVYAPRIVIDPLAPTTTGTDVPGYGALKQKVNVTANTPTGIAKDAAGNIYLADISAGGVFKIPVGGGVAELIGAGFNTPFGVATDAAGNVYVADLGDTIITRIHPGAGHVRDTLAKGIAFPTALAVDASGNLFVTSGTAHRGIFKYPAGGGAKIALDTTSFTNPYGIALDAAGNIYVADANDTAIKRIPAGGGAAATIGTVTYGSTGITVDSLNNVYAIDAGNNAVKKFPANGGAPTTIASGFVGPFGLVLDKNDNLYVSDNGNGELDKITPVGGFHITPSLPVGLMLNDTTGVITGNPGVLSPAKDYTVTTYNSGGSVSATVNIAVKEIPELSSLTLSKGTLSPVFDKNILAYHAAVDSAAAFINITPTVRDTTERIKINGTLVVSGAAQKVLLVKGDNTINVVVTALDNSTKIYVLTVNRSMLSNSAGIVLTVTPASTLSLTTGPSTVNYFTSVSPDVAMVTITPKAANPGAVITIEGVPITSGSASAPITLNTGATTVHLQSIAEDGITIRTYSVIVNRNGSSNVGLNLAVSPASTLTRSTGSANFNYTTSVVAGTGSITITPTPSAQGAVVTVEGAAVNSGMASAPIRLTAAQTTVHMQITAPDGVTTRNYAIVVSRNGSSNVGLNFSMDPANTLTRTTGTADINYVVSVASGINSVTVTPKASDPDAIVTVEGAVVPNSVASAPITLHTGATTIHMQITAPDGITIRTYSIVVNRNGSSNAGMSVSLTPASTLTPVAGTADVNYVTSVSAATSTVNVIPKASDPDALITVEGAPIASGATSAPITLTGTSTTIHLQITAPDRVTVRTYAIVVNRNGSSNVGLNLSMTPSATLTRVTTGDANYNYVTSVTAGTNSVTITPVPSAVGAVVTVEGTVVSSGVASAPITLSGSVTTIHLQITAPDGVTTRSYAIAVNRTGSSNVGLALKTTPTTTLTTTTGSSNVNYAASVASGVNSITVTPNATDLNAVIRVEGTVVASGTASSAIALGSGTTTIHIQITAQDGVTIKTFEIQVSKSAASLSFVSKANDVQAGDDAGKPVSEAVVVHQGVSPNGDGINDYLIIDGLTNADNHLSVMNGSGVLVFETRGYGSNGNVFDGHSNKNSSLLNAGTYFYSLDYKEGEVTKHKTGYIILKY